MDGLIILGGPMGVYESDRFPHLLEEISLISRLIEQGKPVLGICLGAQLIAAALGSNAIPNKTTEIGWHDVTLTKEGRSDPLFSHFADSEKIFQWHRDTFDLPPDTVLLAHTPACRNQAFRYRTNVYGFQFHMEVDSAMVERWLAVPRYRMEIEESGASPRKSDGIPGKTSGALNP